MEDLKIVCPVCGHEYLPAEIYLPNDFLGKPTEIIRDDSGHIEFYFGDVMDPDADYICDSCGARMHVHADISFNVITSNSANKEHVTYYNKFKKLQLEEQLFTTDD